MYRNGLLFFPCLLARTIASLTLACVVLFSLLYPFILCFRPPLLLASSFSASVIAAGFHSFIHSFITNTLFGHLTACRSQLFRRYKNVLYRLSTSCSQRSSLPALPPWLLLQHRHIFASAVPITLLRSEPIPLSSLVLWLAMPTRLPGTYHKPRYKSTQHRICIERAGSVNYLFQETSFQASIEPARILAIFFEELLEV
jgi:hypothetical protein